MSIVTTYIEIQPFYWLILHSALLLISKYYTSCWGIYIIYVAPNYKCGLFYKLLVIHYYVY